MFTRRTKQYSDIKRGQPTNCTSISLLTYPCVLWKNRAWRYTELPGSLSPNYLPAQAHGGIFVAAFCWPLLEWEERKPREHLICFKSGKFPRSVEQVLKCPLQENGLYNDNFGNDKWNITINQGPQRGDLAILSWLLNAKASEALAYLSR